MSTKEYKRQRRSKTRKVRGDQACRSAKGVYVHGHIIRNGNLGGGLIHGQKGDCNVL